MYRNKYHSVIVNSSWFVACHASLFPNCAWSEAILIGPSDADVYNRWCIYINRPREVDDEEFSDHEEEFYYEEIPHTEMDEMTANMEGMYNLIMVWLTLLHLHIYAGLFKVSLWIQSPAGLHYAELIGLCLNRDQLTISW